MSSIKIQAFEDNTDPLINQYDNVEKIYFAGGEPLIMPEHFRTLTELIQRGRSKNIQIVYNSNLTKIDYNNHDLINYWKNFRRITVGASIDAVGERAEYIRHGIPWKNIESNLQRLMEFKKESKNFDFYYSPTVSVLNTWHMTDMHRYLWEKNLMPSIDSIMFNILLFPKHYDCRILPDYLKQEVSEKIEKHIEWIKENNGTDRSISQFVSLKNYLDQTVDSKENEIFLKKTNFYDKLRSESLQKTFPEYKRWIKEMTNG